VLLEHEIEAVSDEFLHCRVLLGSKHAQLLRAWRLSLRSCRPRTAARLFAVPVASSVSEVGFVATSSVRIGVTLLNRLGRPAAEPFRSGVAARLTRRSFDGS